MICFIGEPMLNVVLTGGIASGKSEAAKIFQSLGVPIIDADAIAHHLLAIGTSCYQQVIQHFGQAILLPNKTINRSHLADIIFSDINEKTWLENLLHPAILLEIKKQITILKLLPSPPIYCILDIPLYAEIILSPSHPLKNDFKKLANKVVIIDTDETTQKQRLLARFKQKNINTNEEKINKIIAAQTTRQARNPLADIIILNNQDLSYLQAQLMQLHLSLINT